MWHIRPKWLTACVGWCLLASKGFCFPIQIFVKCKTHLKLIRRRLLSGQTHLSIKTQWSQKNLNLMSSWSHWLKAQSWLTQALGQSLYASKASKAPTSKTFFLSLFTEYGLKIGSCGYSAKGKVRSSLAFSTAFIRDCSSAITRESRIIWDMDWCSRSQASAVDF